MRFNVRWTQTVEMETVVEAASAEEATQDIIEMAGGESFGRPQRGGMGQARARKDSVFVSALQDQEGEGDSTWGKWVADAPGPMCEAEISGQLGADWKPGWHWRMAKVMDEFFEIQSRKEGT